MADSKKFEWALPIGTKLEGGSFPYEIVEHLGQGGFGITYKVKARVYINNIGLDAFFAVKEYFPTGCWRGDSSTHVLYSRALEDDMKAGLADFITEGKRLQEICKLNSNIVNVNEVFRANDTAYYVMEYLDGGDLRQLVKENGSGVSEAKMMSIMRPIAEAIQCLHDKNMLHLDIKPENIVMRRSPDGRPDEPVLIDFGIAVHFDSKGNPTTKNPSIGVSAGYSPKEQYAGVKTFDPRLDIYALSATCFYMLTGKDPVDALNMPSGFVREELPEDLSDLTTNAICRGMSHDKSDRQRSVTKFLHDFEAQHSLPVGAVINGQLNYYMISEVDVEENDYIHYVAIPWTGDPHSGDSDTHRTSSVSYDVWEWWQPSFRREGQVVNTGGTPAPQGWWLPIEKAKLSEPGTYQENEVGAIFAELVAQNNTLYCIVRQDWTPKKSGGDMWKRIKRPLLTGLLVIAGLLVMGVAGYYIAKSLNKPRTERSEADESSVSQSESIEKDEPIEETKSEPKVETVKDKEFDLSSGKMKYTGPVDENGLPNGKGEGTYVKDGSSYKGEFLHGKLHGEGTYLYDGGDIFVGTLDNDNFVKGKFYLKSRNEYFEGSFSNDAPNENQGQWHPGKIPGTE